MEKKSATIEDVVSVFQALLEKVTLDDLERAISLLFDQDQINVVFIVLENLTNEKRLPELKRELIVLSWLEALSRHWLHINMKLMTLYQPIILSQDNRVLYALINSLKTSSF